MREKGKTRQVEIPDLVQKLMDEHPELRPLIDFLLEKIAELEKENRELKRRLALYENAHVPPSQRRYPTRYNGGSSRGGKRFPGRLKGHPSATRPAPKPNVVVRPK
jgi:hypothetical protein